MEPIGFRAFTPLTLGFVAFVCLLLGACGTPTHDQPAGRANATVVEVIDGDTVRLRLASPEQGTNRTEIVRLLGVDTPETIDPNRPAQCFGAEATTFLEQLLVPGTAVLLVRDQQTRDAFGRFLGYLFVEDLRDTPSSADPESPTAPASIFVNLELLRQGFGAALSISPNTTYRAVFAQAVREARHNRVGLWAVCDGPDQPLDP